MYNKNSPSNIFINFSEERSQFCDDGYAVLGRALTYATAFEANCRILNSLQTVKERQKYYQTQFSETTDAFSSVVEEIWNLRLRKHIQNVVEQNQWVIFSDTRAALNSAREARNQLAHELALGLTSLIVDDHGRSEFAAQVAVLTEKIAIGFLIVGLTIQIETNEAIPTPEFLAEYPRTIVRWVTAL